MSVGVAEFSRGIPEAYGDGDDIASPPHFPPFHVDRRRQRIEPRQEGDDLPDRRIGNLVAPPRHPGVTHTVLHDPVQLPVRLAGWRTCELRDRRIEVRTAPLTGAPRDDVASRTSDTVGLHTFTT